MSSAAATKGTTIVPRRKEFVSHGANEYDMHKMMIRKQSKIIVRKTIACSRMTW
jgi:hypothetical protein